MANMGKVPRRKSWRN